jgi:hypothetical protein
VGVGMALFSLLHGPLHHDKEVAGSHVFPQLVETYSNQGGPRSFRSSTIGTWFALTQTSGGFQQKESFIIDTCLRELKTVAIYFLQFIHSLRLVRILTCLQPEIQPPLISFTETKTMLKFQLCHLLGDAL